MNGFIDKSCLENEVETDCGLTGNRADHPLAITLEDDRARNASLVGGKAANLASVMSIPGVRVPPGIVARAERHSLVRVHEQRVEPAQKGLPDPSPIAADAPQVIGVGQNDLLTVGWRGIAPTDKT